MERPVCIAIVGDLDPHRPSHVATTRALAHSAEALSLSVETTWLPTRSLAGSQAESILRPFHGVWLAPGSPYDSMDGALKAVRLARERGWPFIGT
jgi:CTP synthase (UTP-ammonia lyase)